MNYSDREKDNNAHSSEGENASPEKEKPVPESHMVERGERFPEAPTDFDLVNDESDFTPASELGEIVKAADETVSEEKQIEPADDSEQKERIPDKEAALILLHEMLGKEPYEPKQPVQVRQVQASPTPIPQEPEQTPVVREIKPLPENVEAKLRKRIQAFKRDKK